jgi:hypothetical protein
MPLAFQSINRGLIAFGFFNIDTDLLLLDHYFLFAHHFCQNLGLLADNTPEHPYETSWEAYAIDRRDDIGDLMGAIHGTRFTGFIGEIYKYFPFPQREADFKQKPDGSQNRSLVTTVIEGYAEKRLVPLRLDPANGTISIGELLFSKAVFGDLIEYVWLGGYPRWKDGVRPRYVLAIKKKIEQSGSWLFSGLHLS